MPPKTTRVRNRKLSTAWDDEDKLNLITAVQKYPVLWNNSCADFLHRDKKADAWVAVADELSKEGKHAKDSAS